MHVSAQIPPAPQADVARATKAAEALEAHFLAEFLKESGVGALPNGFGGGAGEDQFSSFLSQEYAKEMAQSGGIGLQSAIIRSLISDDST